MSDEILTGQAYTEAHCSVSFYARLAVTDGGEPLDLYEDGGSATIERGEDNVVAEGEDLEEAWENYLCIVDEAPISVSDLSAMWVEYDKQNDPAQPRRENGEQN
jgi:hypothetical protein